MNSENIHFMHFQAFSLQDVMFLAMSDKTELDIANGLENPIALSLIRGISERTFSSALYDSHRKRFNSQFS